MEANMIAIKQILVATDFSEPAGVALAYGRDLARAFGADVHVLHVIEDLPAFYGPDIGFALAGVDQNITDAVQRELESMLAAHHDDAVKVVPVVTRASNVAAAITDYASAHAIDLIIVGTHGRGAVSRFLMGSVAERVVRSAPCPVLTVRADERNFVVVKDDDVSETSGVTTSR
jgi:nucleotide-binding universal stress UspA family protein